MPIRKWLRRVRQTRMERKATRLETKSRDTRTDLDKRVRRLYTKWANLLEMPRKTQKELLGFQHAMREVLDMEEEMRRAYPKEITERMDATLAEARAIILREKIAKMNKK